MMGVISEGISGVDDVIKMCNTNNHTDMSRKGIIGDNNNMMRNEDYATGEMVLKEIDEKGDNNFFLKHPAA